MKRCSIIFAIGLLAIPFSSFGASLAWYTGVSVSAASLRPDTQNSPFELESGVSVGGGGFLGFDITRRINVELAYNYLGSATLTSVSSENKIGYTAISGGVLMYVYGDAADIAERSGLAGYIRLGVSSMDNSANIPLEREDNVAILAGLGLEWPFSDHLNLRGELTSFDGDAQAVRLSMVYRPRSASRRTPTARAPKPEQPRTAVVPAPNANAEIANTTESARTAADTAAESTAAAPTVVEDSRTSNLAEQSGTALSSGPLAGVDFVSGTAKLTPSSAAALNRLSDKLKRNPAAIVEIQAHTESFGSDVRAKDIARQRSIAVARYLAGQGIDVKRLRARAFGHSRPMAADNTVAGRRLNNRIDLQVLR